MRKPIVRGWSTDELERLKQLANAGASVTRCAAAVNRSSASIRSQARKLGIPLAGTRAVRAVQKARISAAERDLPPGSQRFDGRRT